MVKVLIVYYSRTGKTREMAEFISQGVRKGGGDALLKEATAVSADELDGYDGIIIGSPTYYGSMCWEIKKIFDETVKFHGRLDGKVGAAFTSSANVAGGNETAALDILHAMLIHGMIIQGDPLGDHYGPVAVNTPDERAVKQCMRIGERVARLAKRLRGA